MRLSKGRLLVGAMLLLVSIATSEDASEVHVLKHQLGDRLLVAEKDSIVVDFDIFDEKHQVTQSGGSAAATDVLNGTGDTLSRQSDSCAALSNCKDCYDTNTCHWCGKDQSCHTKGSVYGCTVGSTCSKGGNHTGPPADKNHTRPSKNSTDNSKSCAARDNCEDCYNTHTCHWCESDEACHTRGSIYGT